MDTEKGKEVEELLNQVTPIVKKNEEKQREKKERGENFTIFQVLISNQHKEHIHTPFLRELLDINGEHGLKDAFLQAFMDDIVRKLPHNEDFTYNVKKSHIDKSDHYISNAVNPQIYGKIDIFLHDDQKHAIIIENKFNKYGGQAEDQKDQLKRYSLYGEEEYKRQFILIYLTPQGLPASSYSTGDTTNYFSLSYCERGGHPSIVAWLKDCVQIAAEYPLIRETIKQYIQFINLQLGTMEKENLKPIYNAIAEHFDSAEAILNAFNNRDFYIYIFQKKAEPVLRDFALKNKLLFTKIPKDGSFVGICFSKDDWKLGIRMEDDDDNKQKIWWTIRNVPNISDQRTPENILGDDFNNAKQLEQFDGKLPPEWKKWNPYGWCYDQDYTSFDHETAAAIINGEFTEHIKEMVENILKEIKVKGIRMK